MNKLCLLAGLMLSIAGCTITPNDAPDAAATRDRASEYTPTGTLIARRKAGPSILNTTQVDKQALENDRTNNSR